MPKNVTFTEVNSMLAGSILGLSADSEAVSFCKMEKYYTLKYSQQKWYLKRVNICALHRNELWSVNWISDDYVSFQSFGIVRLKYKEILFVTNNHRHFTLSLSPTWPMFAGRRVSFFIDWSSNLLDWKRNRLVVKPVSQKINLFTFIDSNLGSWPSEGSGLECLSACNFTR